MSLTAKLRRAPTRIATGAYILNSGIGKFRGDEDTAKALHGMASNAYPVFEKADHRIFTKALAVGEMALGATLLLPIAPPVVAGAALMAFSGGLLGMYWRTPHLHLPNDPRPTQDGVGIAKDVWMFGIGTSLVLDAMTAPMHDKKKDVAAQVKRSATAAGKAVEKAADRLPNR